MILILFISDYQTVAAQELNDPKGAFLRSMIVPGWGHYYNDHDEWNRGKLHLVSEIAIIAAYIGFQHQSATLKNDYSTLANLRSGVNIQGRNRSFQIALSNFPSLEDYNDFQLRSRNWNRLLEVNNDNNWQWQSEQDRLKYGDLRSKRDRIKNQLPAFFGLMVVNRVISAISAYNRATPPLDRVNMSLLPFTTDNGVNGVITNISFRF
tara:strand:- start:86251 stop:86874 length:624 start_codon:yes stop_codon:yes gene_type:complete